MEVQGSAKRESAEQVVSKQMSPVQMPERNLRGPVWFARIAALIILAWNLQMILGFIIWPTDFGASLELTGQVGSAAARGLGVALLMWNTTFPWVIANPIKYRPVHIIMIIQQAIGVIGESWIWFDVHAAHALLGASISRFVCFDTAGLILLIASFLVLGHALRTSKADNSNQASRTEHRDG